MTRKMKDSGIGWSGKCYTNMEALRASGFGDNLLPPVGAAHQPGATNMEALRASKLTIHTNVGTKNAVGVQGL